MGVLREISRLPEALQRVTSALMRVVAKLDLLIDQQEQQGPAEERLEELERSRARWEAEIEAMLLKADSTLKSAANAESRARTMMKHAEKLDPFHDEGEAAEAPIVQGGYAPASEEEGLLPMHLDVAPLNSKALALRAKYSL